MTPETPRPLPTNRPIVNISDSEGSEAEAVDSIELEYPKHGGPLLLMSQVPRVRSVARAAIDQVLVDLCFTDAFPDVFMQTKYAFTALVKCAEKLGHHDIAQRISNDQGYAKALAAIVCHPSLQ